VPIRSLLPLRVGRSPKRARNDPESWQRQNGVVVAALRLRLSFEEVLRPAYGEKRVGQREAANRSTAAPIRAVPPRLEPHLRRFFLGAPAIFNDWTCTSSMVRFPRRNSGPTSVSRPLLLGQEPLPRSNRMPLTRFDSSRFPSLPSISCGVNPSRIILSF